MTFFLDINIPYSFGKLLRKEGHEVILGADSGFHGKSDWEICEFAKQKKAIVITHDLDFGELLAVSGASKPSVIIFRIHPLTKSHINEVFWKAWEISKSDMEKGAILVLEEEKFRIRKLPIDK